MAKHLDFTQNPQSGRRDCPNLEETAQSSGTIGPGDPHCIAAAMFSVGGAPLPGTTLTLAISRLALPLFHFRRRSGSDLGWLHHRHSLRNKLSGNQKYDAGLAVHSRCVEEGSKYGLWSGNKVYILEPQEKVLQFAAKNVRVTGTMTGETIQVATIQTIKTEAQKKP